MIFFRTNKRNVDVSVCVFMSTTGKDGLKRKKSVEKMVCLSLCFSFKSVGVALRCHSVLMVTLFVLVCSFCLLWLTLSGSTVQLHCVLLFFHFSFSVMSIDIDLIHFFYLDLLFYISHMFCFIIHCIFSLVYYFCFNSLLLPRSLLFLSLSLFSNLFLFSQNALLVCVCVFASSLLFVHFHYHNLGCFSHYFQLRTLTQHFSACLFWLRSQHHSRQRFGFLVCLFVLGRFVSFLFLEGGFKRVKGMSV